MIANVSDISVSFPRESTLKLNLDVLEDTIEMLEMVWNKRQRNLSVEKKIKLITTLYAESLPEENSSVSYNVSTGENYFKYDADQLQHIYTTFKTVAKKNKRTFPPATTAKAVRIIYENSLLEENASIDESKIAKVFKLVV